MEAVLIAIGVNILTWLWKKLNLSWTYLAVGLSFLFGTIYFIFMEYNPLLLETLKNNIIGIFGYSQLIYLALVKLWILKKK